MTALRVPRPTPVGEVDPRSLLLMPPLTTQLQPYLPRKVDEELDRALASPGFVLVQAESFAGARRSAYEALLRNLPDALLVSHDGGTFEDTDAAVLWVDYHDREREALRREFERLRIWQQDSVARWVMAITSVDDLSVSHEGRLDTSLPIPLPHTVRIRSNLTSDERSGLAERGLDDALQTVAAVYGAVERNAVPQGDSEGDGPAGRVDLPDGLFFQEPGEYSAGYHPDTDTGEDRLGITADVHMLADLVASRHITPPLSVGLFGDWGSGKSFFMRRMRMRVRELAAATARAEQAARRSGPAVSGYCSSIRQITFNAWHYAESNLWASLATHLLDNLASSGSEDDLERHANDLAERRRHQKSLLDQLSSIRVERMLMSARLEREARRTPSPSEVARALGQVMADENWVTDAAGLPQETLDQVRAFADEATGLASGLRNLWRRLAGTRTTGIVVGLGVATAALVFLLANSVLWPSVVLVLTGAVSLTPALSAVRASVRRIRSTADRLTARAEEPARARLAELDTEQTRLEQALADLAPAQDLAAFARDRSPDYRRHLSVVSLLRRDLEVFAAMLARDRHGAGETAGPERIVLYIDDLDRCPPDVVVKVLEAVHLLLAQPVFAIVVGADVNWLMRSLAQHYGPVLAEDAAPGDPKSALRYLEKIFQIPLALAPMTGAGFATLIADLGRNEPTAVAPDMPAAAPPEPGLANRPLAGTGPAPAPDAAETPWAAPPEPRLRPRQLEITQDELDYIAGLAPLVRSPRSAKRLINLYRLLRARLQDDQLAAFLEGREPGYRAAIPLLALMASPTDASALFHAIEHASGHATWRSLLEDLPHLGTPELRHLSTAEQVPSDLTAYRGWLPLVRRFSFTTA
ncbi:P-loop NTPase fold protein [Glycomyces amatae]|uniref:P-loop NTPase fold protein n=1 Tax=Glycomyces amatae TaxID=2881355 RepID=UPI00272A5521|nr:P-loop NTPase fold protein [Glycomyces amatae]